jgi:hypothetical protein
MEVIVKKFVLGMLTLVLLTPVVASAHRSGGASQNYYPLKIGDWWVYKETLTTGALTITERVISSTSHHGITTAVVQSQQAFGKRKSSPSQLIYIRDAHGIYLTPGMHAKWQLLLPLPPLVGKHWTEPAVIRSVTGKPIHTAMHYWIVKGGTITISHHTYTNTIQLVYGICSPHLPPSPDRCGTERVFFAPNVGKVLVLGLGQPELSLVRYHVK